MPETKPKKDSNSLDSSKEDKSKSKDNELNDEDINHVTGGVAAILANCPNCGNSPCTCANVL